LVNAVRLFRCAKTEFMGIEYHSTGTTNRETLRGKHWTPHGAYAVEQSLQSKTSPIHKIIFLPLARTLRPYKGKEVSGWAFGGIVNTSTLGGLGVPFFVWDNM